jgi:hypothetical protein
MKFVTIKKAHFEADLLVLKAKLESEGISCYLHNQYTTQVMNYMPTFAVELKVENNDLERARTVLLDLER